MKLSKKELYYISEVIRNTSTDNERVSKVMKDQHNMKVSRSERLELITKLSNTITQIKTKEKRVEVLEAIEKSKGKYVL